jgi:SAM-dependent methyltransferase
MMEHDIDKAMEKSPYKYISKEFVKKLSMLIKAPPEAKSKLIRAKLRKISTSALPIKFYKKFKSLKFSKDLIIWHRSTRERIEIYPWLIQQIQKRGQTIVDLGCGFNLLALYYHDFIPKQYTGYDIDGAVTQFINRFAKEKEINAKAQCKDILNTDIKQAEICLAFKVFDAIEDVEWNLSRKILQNMKKKCKQIIASFSNISLSGRGKLRKRDWFEKTLDDLGYKWEKQVKGNETFYFID